MVRNTNTNTNKNISLTSNLDNPKLIGNTIGPYPYKMYFIDENNIIISIKNSLDGRNDIPIKQNEDNFILSP